MPLNLGKIYGDICKGYTEVSLLNSKYYKHFSSMEIGFIEEYAYQMVEEYKSKGALGEKELLEKRIEEGLWSKDKDEKMEFLERNINLMVSKKHKASVPSQIDSINELIKDYEKEYVKLSVEKDKVLHLSAESLADSAKMEYKIHKSFFNDKNCLENSFSLDDVISFSTEELVAVLNIYKSINEELNDSNIRNISVRSYVKQAIKNSSGIEAFFGKKGCDLSSYQIKLFDYTNYFAKLLEKIEFISAEDRENPDEIETLFILEMNKDEKKEGVDRGQMVDKFAKAKEFGK